MDNKTFSFKLIDMVSFTTKGDKQMYRVITYCNFGFIVNFFVTPEKAKLLMEKQKQNNFNINDYIKIFYDNNKQEFAYIININ